MVSGRGFPGGRETYNGPIWSVSAEIAGYIIFWFSRTRLAERGVLYPLTIALVCIDLRFIGIENDILRRLYHFMFGVVVFLAAAAVADRAVSVALVAFGLTGGIVSLVAQAVPLAVLLMAG